MSPKSWIYSISAPFIWESSPRCRITLDRQDFLHMVLWCLRKTSEYDRKKLVLIKIVHKGVEVNFWKSIVFFVKEAAWLWQKELEWVPQKKRQRQSVISRCIHSIIFQQNYPLLTCRNFGPRGYQIENESKMAGEKKQKCNLGRCALFTGVNNYLSEELLNNYWMRFLWYPE